MNEPEEIRYGYMLRGMGNQPFFVEADNIAQAIDILNASGNQFTSADSHTSTIMILKEQP